MSKYKVTRVLKDGNWSCTEVIHTSRNGKWVSRFWTITGDFPKYMRTLTYHDSAEHIKNAKKGGKYEGAERWVFINDKRIHFESRVAHEKYMKTNGLSSSWNRIHT
jgi:hypothetical protein